jgi:hypothetical protein
MFFSDDSSNVQQYNPVIFDVAKLSSFPLINEDYLFGNHLVCKHYSLDEWTWTYEWSVEGCLINTEKTDRVAC